MKIAHVITSLDDGGAEAVLYRLCLADSVNTHVVISLQGPGKYGPLFETEGISVHQLDMPRGKLSIRGLVKLVRLLRSLQPSLVQTWMYHADLIGGLAARSVGIRNVFWGLHNTNLDSGKTKRATIFLVKINALLSHWVPKRVVSCSQKGVLVHQLLGFAKNKFSVVHNGYDLNQFAPDPELGQVLRSTLAIPRQVPLFGMVARFDPQKDHLNLITALGLLKKSGVDFRCVLVGPDMTQSNGLLNTWLDTHDLRDRVLLLGQRSDIQAVMNMLDVHVLSSCGEAFPNVLCEAMACATPCVTTDAGDSALIVGDTGWVVPTNSAQLLSQAMADSIKAKCSAPSAWKRRETEATRRIAAHFCVATMVDNYNRVWAS